MSVQSAATDLKALQARLMQTEADLLAASNEVKAVQQREGVIRRQRHELLDKIAKLKTEVAIDPYVTEHAIVRYFERVMGFDMDAIRDTILDASTKKMVAQMKSGKFPREGFKIIAKNAAIVSIETPELVKSGREKGKVKPPRYREVDDGADDEAGIVDFDLAYTR